MDNREDAAFRAAAFSQLLALAPDGGPIPWSSLAQGFVHNGRTHHFASQALGIFAPKAMGRLLSIKSVVPKPGRDIWYDDQKEIHREILGNGETLRYAMQGKDPDNRHNRLLQNAFEHQLPFVYFIGAAPGVYTAVFPATIAGIDRLTCTVDIAAPTQHPLSARDVVATPPASDAVARRYGMRQVQQRLHQARFRTGVLEAYGGRCALSNLPEPRLLDAAHIVPDGDLRLGQPVVANGMAMSRLHHAAYDACLLGIDPKGRIHVSPRLLEQQDGPILQALQNLHGSHIRMPKRPQHQPDPARLAQRFSLFEEQM